ncbi:methionyl-tRNA formyltransferase [Ectothiorhodospira lacustris]|uniref:methionyl-tRNA formyltransferase n=1 Tax=Ectothiorhodospira lacustris TaxID=2899127 RepID=UPI001EE852F5|nr:methionyl-tRNA formyltransferase [Ectothiorhodospira lacustris]MCG5501734.1 methionyl-tRNA formyltransferase [Ectothiorhodospira lacustris]MCG5509157.1 methionyl-tRNA formyltransferase [Ectothiorhodospira lacustris]MCG5520947.1 methionyl-tRNA formyltransferase [Ectothiorhodospira lacustris]
MPGPLRIIYAGTPHFAVPALEALIASPHDIVAVYTQPDRPAGRGRKLTPSPVKQVALAHGVPVEQPERLRPEPVQERLRGYRPDLMVVAAYGLILPQSVLDIPRLGCVNIHASLLPRWRGAAPIQRALAEGDERTGVTLMQMAAGLDTGDMLRKGECPITPADTAQTLHDQLAVMGAKLLLPSLDDLAAGRIRPEPQDESQATYARKLDKAEALLDWSRPAAALDRCIRAFNPWPVAQTLYQGQPLRLWMSRVLPAAAVDVLPGTVVAEGPEGIDVATGEGILRITCLQLPGGKPLAAAAFLNARSLLGTCLGQDTGGS